MKSLEEVLRNNGVELVEGTVGYAQGKRGKFLEGTDFRLVISKENPDSLEFYLHPLGRSGDTVNGVLKGNDIQITSVVQ